MKKLERKIKRPYENYLKIETSGLSKDRDSIIAISLAEKNRDVLKTFYLENLKEEEKLLEEVLPLLYGKKFVTYSGKSFDLPFIREKVKFYFNRDFDLHLIDLQEVTKKYNFIFNLESHSNKTLLEKFIGKDYLKDQKEYQGIKIKNLFKKYLEGDESAIEKILDYNFMSLENLIILDRKIKKELEKNLSLEILDFTFFIRNIRLLDNSLEICGDTNYDCDYFSTKTLYTLEINEVEKVEKFIEYKKNKESEKVRLLGKNSESINFYEIEKNSESLKSFEFEKNNGSANFYESTKNKDLDKKFSLKINTEDGLYDGKTSCYYVKKKDLDFDLTNLSKIKSPDPIQILYYKNHVYKNQVEIMRKIIEKELGQ
ncbi:exonuclease [Peptoniphilus gorbachii]|uniref:YprB ribonuclease H-like domain-containing protein n=1 Tax=Peptoniphilus gorbachii TaxID=411567 RepID=A0A6N2Y972_9FIRM